MSTIFGYPSIKAEIVALINNANADYGANFTPEELELTREEFDSFEGRQRFGVRDLSGRYFGRRDDVGVFKRNFQVLFKGIELHVQSGSGLSNRKILESLSSQYGLPPFTDDDFAPGLLDLTTHAGDAEVFVSWPIADTSWSWTGSVEFYLRNTKTSLGSIITDGVIDAFTGNDFSGITWSLRKTPLNGLFYPNHFDLDRIITETELNGLEYPGSYDLNTLIHITDLDGLEYPSEFSLTPLIGSLVGLEYPPTIALNNLTQTVLSGMEYPNGVGTSRYSALLLTRPLDFSNYQNAIQRFRVGDNITDTNLVSVIVGKIADAWGEMNTDARKSRLTVAFTNAKIVSIEQKRSIYGWTETVTVQPSSNSFIVGNAVLNYDIESVD